MARKFFSLCLAILLVSESFAQINFCTTPSNSPDFLQGLPPATSITRSGNYCVRVYVHLIKNLFGTGGLSDADAEAGLAILKQDFEAFGINFIVQGIDEIHNDALYNNTNKVLSVAFDDDQDGKFDNPIFPSHSDAIDIYLLDGHSDFVGGKSARIHSSSYIVGGVNNEGVKYARTHIISHEMGHCLGLFHTFHGFILCENPDAIDPNPCQELVNGTNCSSCGDFVCDTPADPTRFNVDETSCNRIFPNNCRPSGANNDIDVNGDHYSPLDGNIMDYLPIQCYNSFTSGQGDRMKEHLDNSTILQSVIENSTVPDLYIKDRPEDIGREDFPYDWQADRDESPDIWVRNQQDGQNNQTHQDPEYSSNAPVWVYVRVRNKSCASSDGSEKLKLYWSKASSWSSWPENWDGTMPTLGNLIGELTIPTLAPGEEIVLEFAWNIMVESGQSSWGNCLLARIENSPSDPITIYPDRLDDDVFLNNNIAMRNVTVVDIIPGLAPPGDIQRIYYPHGNHIYLGNPTGKVHEFDFDFGIDAERDGGIASSDVQVKLIFDWQGWDLLKPYLEKSADVRIIQDREIILTNGSLNLERIRFNPRIRIPVYFGYEVTNTNVSKIENMMFHFRQYMSTDHQILGGVHFQLNYDKKGTDHIKSPHEGPIVEKPNKITRLSPNPSENHVKVDYMLVKGNEAKLFVVDQSGAHFKEIRLNTNDRSYELDMTGMERGTYTVTLIVDQVAQDTKSLLLTP
ncbi:MAG: hypothetical protein EP338_09815 [Bacteroidetes bacterium]|nr:MAG: hypothetical protein EP338_09815 [Bacteroidota bacterium]